MCTRNDDLASIIEGCPGARRRDLVFLQNGMLDPLLARHGLALDPANPDAQPPTPSPQRPKGLGHWTSRDGATGHCGASGFRASNGDPPPLYVARNEFPRDIIETGFISKVTSDRG